MTLTAIESHIPWWSPLSLVVILVLALWIEGTVFRK